ncbi:hypothetical protein M407DRAFT_242691 [Tulasnella calospora MUT 4182]|uniref:Uncharacterized protein n=1 Tax=Tulasnella calospora MUT 4182 TaxID=1051891 RepID=A0A0C3L5W0_9AGAM|nr:hypothetical protein M407DRAFT_242691 [Tulasnella calospora MUT 4182]
MPPKTLSNGTLALKFMQKAALKTQNGDAPVVQLHQAKVVDEAEWDVGKEVRQAWGLASSGDKTAGPSGSSSTGIIYETSYLPFLYGQVEDDVTDDDEEDEVSQSLLSTTSRPGRWSNLKVEEPKAKTEPQVKDEDAADKPTEDLEHSPSALNSPSSSGDPPLSSSKKKDKRKLEDEDDIEQPVLSTSSSGRLSQVHATTGFLRPAGVDAPSGSAPKAHEASTAPKRKKKKGHEPGL